MLHLEKSENLPERGSRTAIIQPRVSIWFFQADSDERTSNYCVRNTAGESKGRRHSKEIHLDKRLTSALGRTVALKLHPILLA